MCNPYRIHLEGQQAVLHVRCFSTAYMFDVCRLMCEQCSRNGTVCCMHNTTALHHEWWHLAVFLLFFSTSDTTQNKFGLRVSRLPPATMADHDDLGWLFFSLSLYIYIYVYVCMCLYIHIYTYIYILGVLLYADLRGGRDYFLFLFGFRQIRVCIFRGERYYYQKGTNRLFVHKGVRHVHMHINRKFWAPRKVSHLVCGFKTQIPNSSPRL